MERESTQKGEQPLGRPLVPEVYNIKALRIFHAESLTMRVSFVKRIKYINNEALLKPYYI